MNCSQCRELLVGYIEGLLDDNLNQAVRSHLNICSECRKELEQVTALQKRLVANGAGHGQNDLENAVMDRIVREQALKLRKTNQVKQNLNFWRFIMRSPITKLAMAAAVIIAAGLAIYYFAGEGTQKCCAWTKIADKVAQIKTCICNIHIQQSGPTLGQKGKQVEAKVYISSDYGYVTETSVEGNVLQRMYMMTDDNAMVVVMPSEKKYMRMVLGDYQAKMKSQMQDPRTMVIQLVSGMSGQYKELGKDTIDGVEVRGIEVNNPPAVQAIYSNFIGRLWVDAATEYPVRMEVEAEVGTGNDTIKMLMVMDGFEWGAELAPAIFEPNIPSDYKMMAEMKIPAQDEASAIEGLRIFAEMTDGNYPSQMNVMTLTKESTEFFVKKFGPSKKTKPTDEERQQMTAAMMKVQAPVLFYTKLGRDGNDPAYYGKDVNAGDANSVLMHWKISQGDYRVIYGDLSTENVTAEKLKEMERAAQQ
jgi:outer membrane lipoprotein-sorting protein